MKSPVNLLSDFIIEPLNNARRYVQYNRPVQAGFNKLSNFIFKYSKETALIMLFCNFISTLSSHNSQIRGLKKSDRENKDYLIDLEKKERLLDCVLNIVPPFIMNNFLKKKLESGVYTTESAREKLIKHIAADGFARDDLYSIEHIRPVRETIYENLAKLTKKITNNSKYVPKRLLAQLIKFNNYLKDKYPDPITTYYKGSLEDITTDIDDRIREHKISPETLEKMGLRNNSAYDEFNGLNNGLQVMATIAYMIVASNLIMPILKHNLSKRAEKKQLEKMGETQESIKLKRRLALEENIFKQRTQNTVFNDFIPNNNSYREKITPKSKENVFSSFEQYNKYHSNSTIFKV